MSTICTAEISSKIFGDQKICAGDQILKLRSEPAGPKDCFLKSSPEVTYIFYVVISSSNVKLWCVVWCVTFTRKSKDVEIVGAEISLNLLINSVLVHIKCL